MLQNDTKGEICMQRPNRPPALVPAAARLLYICLTLNCLYLLGVALYAGGGTGHSLRQSNAYELLRSAYIASVLALGGALVLDLDLRRGRER